MENLKLFSCFVIGSTEVSENEFHSAVLANCFAFVRDINISMNLNSNTIKEIVKILVLLMFTGFIWGINDDGDIPGILNQDGSNRYNCVNIHCKPVGELTWNGQLEKADLIQCNFNDNGNEISRNWKDITNLEKRLIIVRNIGLAGEKIALKQHIESNVIEDGLNSYKHCELLMFGSFI
jgi:hypothetical protein